MTCRFSGCPADVLVCRRRPRYYDRDCDGPEVKCPREVYARGLCGLHYRRFRVQGTLDIHALPPGKRGPRPGTTGRTRAASDEHTEPDEPVDFVSGREK